MSATLRRPPPIPSLLRKLASLASLIGCRIKAIFDIDSHSPSAFGDEDCAFLAECAATVGAFIAQHSKEQKLVLSSSLWHWRVFVHLVNREGRVCDRCAGSHLGSHPDRFHDLLAGGASSLRASCMAADAVWTLGYVGYRDCDEFLGFRWQRAMGKDLTAERPKYCQSLRGKLFAVLRNIARCGRTNELFHIHVLSSDEVDSIA
jgi:hypothetical protein